MSFYLRKNSLLITSHREGGAGFKFDENFCSLKGVELLNVLECRVKSKASRLLYTFVFLLLPFVGAFSCISMYRYITSTPRIPRSSRGRLNFSRSLFFLAPMFVKRPSVLLHNIESIYYLEEARSESNFIRKALYYHQSFILKVFEVYFLRRFYEVYCISYSEYRFLRRRGVNAIFIKELLSSSRNYILRNSPSVNKYCFFGDYSNVRNVSMAKKVSEIFPDMRLFGRNGDCLPQDLTGLYGGELGDLKKVAPNYTLVLRDVPRGGIQTKVVDWLENNGTVDIPNILALRMGLCREK